MGNPPLEVVPGQRKTHVNSYRLQTVHRDKVDPGVSELPPGNELSRDHVNRPLVGIYILSTLGQRIDQKDTGLYRDDGLIILRNCDGLTTDRIRKDIIRIFKQNGFKIEIKTNLKEVDFLDVTFDLRKETYQPYKKENDKLFYINTSSNHPTSIIKQIPTSVSHRLSDNSANEEIFNNAKTGI